MLAARTIGARDAVILFRHILPNVITPAIIIATFGVAAAIIGEATLSFLGVGIQAPTPTWGNMLADGRAYVASAWWLATFPGLAIVLTVLSINVIGDWLRDYLDPRLRNTVVGEPIVPVSCAPGVLSVWFGRPLCRLTSSSRSSTRLPPCLPSGRPGSGGRFCCSASPSGAASRWAC